MTGKRNVTAGAMVVLALGALLLLALAAQPARA